MTIELTPQQQDAVDRSAGKPVVMVDPRTNTPYVLISVARLDAIAEVEEDDRFQRAIHDTAFRNAIHRTSFRDVPE